MYAIRNSRDQQAKCRLNILPCRINHNGTANASRRYWSPTKPEDGKSVSYFRGRKLHGNAVRIPLGYKGVILSSKDQKLPKGAQPPDDEEGLDETEQLENVGTLEEDAEFDEVMVWGHETLPDKSADPFVRGVEEWIAFAEQIHSYPSQGSEAQTVSEEP